MAEQFYTILTAVGKAKIANAAAFGKKVELTELALGDGGGSYYNPTEDQTELRNEVWRGAIGTVDVDGENPNWITIQTVVPSQHGGFMIREAGVFDNEGDLIAVGKYPETYKPVAADGSIKDLVIRMILEVSNTASIILKVDPAVILATQQQVNEAEARAKAYTDQEVADLAGEGRTTETVKGNADTLDAHLADYAQHGVTMGHENDLYIAKIRPLFGFTPLEGNYNGNIYAIAIDDEFVYVGGATPQTVKKLRKSDLSQVAESANYGGTIRAIAVDDEFVYVGGTGPQTVRKLWKNNLSQVAESASYGGDIYAMVVDDEFIYVGGATPQTVRKLNKSDLSLVAESASYGGTIYAIAADNAYVYVGGGTTQTVRKLRKSDLSQVAESASYGGIIYAIAADDVYVYIGGTYRYVKKLRKSDLSQVAESASDGSFIRAIATDHEFVYVGGSGGGTAPPTVKKLNKSDLSQVAKSASYGGDIYAIAIDDEFVYVGGQTTHTVRVIENRDLIKIIRRYQ